MMDRPSDEPHKPRDDDTREEDANELIAVMQEFLRNLPSSDDIQLATRILSAMRDSVENRELFHELLTEMESGASIDVIFSLVAESRRHRRAVFQRSTHYLTPAERTALGVVHQIPVTASHLTARAIDQPEDFPKSLTHRSGSSAILNRLVKLGLVGRFMLNRDVYFTTPEEAVRRALIARGEDERRTNPTAIAEATGLSIVSVLEVIQLLMQAEDEG